MISLRAELELVRKSALTLLFDPIRHRYFRVEPDALAEQSQEAAAFLRANELAAEPSPEQSRSLADRAAARREGWIKTALHRYLFLKLPLVRPDRFLQATLPLVQPLASRAFLWLVLLLGAVALALVSRRWDEFGASFASLLSWQGLAFYGIAVAFLKVLHELGHAYALKRRGGSVPSMGVAFVVLFPILYTETSDAWRLEKRRDRLAVDLAGIVVELVVAVFATWAWIVLPDGSARDIAFSLAAVSWTLSLAVNLNPFMRFDGYHVLADALDLPNLQERAFALARWRMRELLFAPGEPVPEPFAPGLRRLLIIYAWATWVYRLVLFAGIALLVYHMAFKLLGIVLFAVEIGWFVLRPVWRELKVWRGLVGPRPGRSWLPLAPIAALIALLALPLDRSVQLPAVLEVGRVHTLRAPEAARIAAVRTTDGRVERGRVVIGLEDPEAPFEAERLAARRSAIAERSVHSKEGLRNLVEAKGELALLVAAHRNAVARTLKLSVIVPSSGDLQLERGVRAGRFVSRGEVLGRVVSTGNAVVALADESRAERLRQASTARFVPDARIAPVGVILRGRSHFPQPVMDPVELSAVHGGPVAIARDRRPAKPHFAVRFGVGTAPELPPGRWRGMVRVDVPGRSYGAALLRRLHSVWIRESGF